ncbi:ubiquinone/menaquinone biosynthesis C-methylase UbiE [Naumannella cuiyingiana]|uniref:Ubiquinone/menaquinone biosynthesis C-methylase UbiE n=1 Tax=Naumannella cuiyingiana TaxID=1347891 RepID=A0A7Z0D845_9ACTN|nr:class I SAM-dependent methyltransferase [Naumannella cuiyingiana]NYI70543.1 ubiquinone/menaquinone biosynthesis C-methylase UbiE [Naumannella cuiyingiana]
MINEGLAGFERDRDRAVAALRGRVLELGAGRGANFARLAPGIAWIGLEPNRRLRDRLAVRARASGHPAAPLAARAEAVPLPDASVDAVLATTVLCSVDEVARALAEAYRVLRPGGRVVLAEHGAAPRGTAARTLQRLLRPATRLLDHGCDPLRDPEAAVAASPLRLDRVARHAITPLLGVELPLLVIEASRRG